MAVSGVARILFSSVKGIAARCIRMPRRRLGPRRIQVTPIFCKVYNSSLRILGNNRPFTGPPIIPNRRVTTHIARINDSIGGMRPNSRIIISPVVTYVRYQTYGTKHFGLYRPPRITNFHTPNFTHSRRVIPTHGYRITPTSLPLGILTFTRPTTYTHRYIGQVPGTSLRDMLIVNTKAVNLSVIRTLHVVKTNGVAIVRPSTTGHTLTLGLNTTRI